MAIFKAHEMHGRRFGRNLGVALALIGFVAVVFGLTLAKVNGPVEGFDHVARPQMVPQEEGQ